MHDSFRVRRIQRIGDLDGHAQQRLQIGTGLPPMRCFSVTPSRNSMAMNGCPSCCANLKNRADVRMAERRGRLRLALKSRQRLRISGHIRRQEFQRHKAVQGSVLSLINHPHTAAAEFLNDPVMRNSLADQRSSFLSYFMLCQRTT